MNEPERLLNNLLAEGTVHVSFTMTFAEWQEARVSLHMSVVELIRKADRDAGISTPRLQATYNLYHCLGGSHTLEQLQEIARAPRPKGPLQWPSKSDDQGDDDSDDQGDDDEE